MHASSYLDTRFRPIDAGAPSRTQDIGRVQRRKAKSQTHVCNERPLFAETNSRHTETSDSLSDFVIVILVRTVLPYAVPLCHKTVTRPS